MEAGRALDPWLCRLPLVLCNHKEHSFKEIRQDTCQPASHARDLHHPPLM